MESNKSFRESMDRLDYIVSQLEQNDVELEEAITLFEEGLHLVKTCDSQLKKFEEQVTTLMETYEGDTEHEES
ncbi:exodeoxyribonuclease VII small subunit [Breznakia sp. PF5-3]|uniref:exodeoxyribonuclease VII small subunit n=1 Tax=unclassified Breznakia TaxID=2623764 RepID=UPI002404F34F|nr:MULTISPECIES: exodeoxyribonuclease VII small subunit [unclassified Breznakia]MDL2276471.1 exodeoxyribonuclease VII small subunit [Breznakia sp. OttesenSCG-928-G09]MDF9823910.1 exodeoxyribonuclease VII small subunit [Breznakia sp. PM6-1]MDF9834709.1 exodeoxyribonuclease VII small subunit [Breznakia sp. PF5-3]MDF9836856.1 exodeoxyribonuclease VII small subunit [Breznakia sp. PFB2-8]MDF9858873.1 exodeoxyribonuclease VII small subunit [Breznakia sp. PH5-24]